ETDQGTRFELGREVAALISGATLIALPGSSHLFRHGGWLAVLEAMPGFLCESASLGPRRPAVSSSWPNWSPRG
ncbi:MAG TPA: hypothetical protein VEG33_11585, partial [Streptosporangiaceae bacterium]|nr:hypothetical protein [Streptosporangiaceae bacterium]